MNSSERRHRTFLSSTVTYTNGERVGPCVASKQCTDSQVYVHSGKDGCQGQQSSSESMLISGVPLSGIGHHRVLLISRAENPLKAAIVFLRIETGGDTDRIS